MIPSVDDLKSSPMVHRACDLYNPPALANSLGVLQAEVDITGLRCLNFPPFSTSFSLSGAFVLHGRHFQSLGVPVTLTWYPDRVDREAQIDQLLVKSTTVLAVGEMAAIVRVEVTNRGSSEVETIAGINIQGCLGKHIRPWNDAYPPHELNNVTRVDNERSAIVFSARESSAVAVQGVFPQPETMRATGIRYALRLAAGESWTMSFVYAIGDSEEQAIALFDRLIGRTDEHIEAAEKTGTPNSRRCSLLTTDVTEATFHGWKQATKPFARSIGWEPWGWPTSNVTHRIP